LSKRVETAWGALLEAEDGIAIEAAMCVFVGANGPAGKPASVRKVQKGGECEQVKIHQQGCAIGMGRASARGEQVRARGRYCPVPMA